LKFWKFFSKIPVGDDPGASLLNFEKLSFLERLNLSSLSKVMAIWSFSVQKFLKPKIYDTTRKHSKHTKIRKHTSCRQWEQNQWTQIDQTKSTKTRKCKNGVNETTKDNKIKRKLGRATREGEHHVPVRTWARKRDRMQKRVNNNVSERELWRNNAHKSENERWRQKL